MPTPRSGWTHIEGGPELQRFAEIMHSMDPRYADLNADALQRLLRERRTDARQNELFGRFAPGSPRSPETLEQVLSIAAMKDWRGRRSRLVVGMVGVAADRVDPAHCTDERIREWLANFIHCLADLLGPRGHFRANPLKTLAWKPMHRLYDMIREGIKIPLPTGSILSSRVVRERDLHDSFLWKIAIDTR